MILRRTAGFLTGLALVVSMATTASSASADIPDAAPALDLVNSVTGPTGDVLLAWEPADGAASYKVELSADESFGSVLESTTTTALTWVPTKVPSASVDRTLFWRVTAIGASTSDWTADTVSLVGQFERAAATAPQPTSPIGTVDYPDAVVFTWEPITGATQYTLQYGEDPTFATTTSVNLTSTAYTTTTLAFLRGKDYVWRVKASFGTGETSPWSDVQSFDVTWSESTPTGLRPTSASSVVGEGGTTYLATFTDLSLSWDSSPGAQYYTIDLATTPDFANPVSGFNNTQVYGTTVAVETVLANATYYWRVTPYDANGVSGSTSAVSQFRRAYGAQDGAEVVDPAIVTATDVTSTYPKPVGASEDSANPTVIPSDGFELSWAPVARASHYVVQIVPNGVSFDSAPAAQKLTCSTPYTSVSPIARVQGSLSGVQTAKECLTGALTLTPGATYKWRVAAIDLSATTSTSFQSGTTPQSQWSDPGIAGLPSQQAFFTPGPAAQMASLTSPVSGLLPASGTRSTQAPVLSWAPAATTSSGGEVGGYRVKIAMDPSFTTSMEFYTTTSRLRINGALKDNTTNDSYYWTVAACTDVTATPDCDETSSVPQSFKKSSGAPDLANPAQDPDGTVSLAWSPATSTSADTYEGGTRGYEVQVATSDNFTVVKVDVKVDVPFTSLSKTARGLANNATYYVRVRSLDASGTARSWSEPKSFYKSGPAPTPAATSARPDRALVSWTATAGAKTYRLDYTGALTTGTTVTGTQTGIQGTAWAFQSLSPGVYTWKVAMTDGFGVAQPFDQSGQFALSAPALTTSGSAVVSPADRSLTWSSSDATAPAQYLVQFSTLSNFSSISKAVTTSAHAYTPVTSDNLTPGTYYWRVFPATIAGKALTGTATVSTLTVVAAPTTPSKPTVKAVGNQLVVTWTVPTAAAGRGDGTAPTYLLRHRVYGDTTWVVDPAGWTAAGAATRTLGPLDEDTSYEVELMAANTVGASAWSPVSTKVTTQSRPNPASAVTASSIKTDSIALRWVAPTSTTTATKPTGYAVRYTGPDMVTHEVSATSTSATLTGLTAGTNYLIEVWSRNDVGLADAPAEASITTIAVASKPMKFTVVRGDRSAALAWSAPTSNGGTPITRYVVETRSYSATTKSWGTWGSKTASSTTLTLTSLTNGTKYQSRVYAVNAAGNGKVTSALTFTPAGKPSAPTGVKATATTGKITVKWTKPVTNGATISGYQVKYSLNGTTWYTMPKVAASKTSTVLTTKKGKTYSFKVTALSNLGASLPSSTVKAVAK